MTLDPHHFQQWDRYQQLSMNSRFRTVQHFDWGVVSLDIDKERLANGEFTIRQCAGVTHDGLFFNSPDDVPLPKPQSLKDHFSPSAERLGVYLSVPVERDGGVNCQLLDSTPHRLPRFVSETVSLNDDTTGGNTRNVTVCTPNLSIIFETEPKEEFTTLHIADVVRAGDGSYQLGAKHIPPALSLSASENLMKLTRRILESLISKGNALSERRRQQPAGQIEYTTADVTLLGILQTLNSFIPILNYYYHSGSCHPETLYCLLASLAGQLMTFSSDHDMRPTDLPSYDHAHATECFFGLESKIALLLETILSSNFVRIRLSKQTENQWTAAMPDHNILATAQFFLAASGDVPERKLAEELPSKIKVGSPEDVPMLVSAALPGVAITFSTRPPVGLPSRPSLQYFKIEKTGRFWDAVVRTQTMALFIPAEFRGLQCELYAIKAGQ
jgi:type VI secretion system protein ImpJ